MRRLGLAARFARAARRRADVFAASPRIRRAPGAFTRGSGRSSMPASTCALESMLRRRPTGFFWTEPKGGASVQHLAAKLAVFEARAGLADGAMAIIAGAAGTPAAIFALGSYKDCSRKLVALAWERDALARALELDDWPGVDAAPLVVARGLLVLGAAAAGLPALDAPSLLPNEVIELRDECLVARADGFKGKLATTLEEIAIFDEIFPPGS